MDIQQACDILGITHDRLDKISIRRAYLTAALRYHPDKNKDKNSNVQFNNVQCAYEYLNETLINKNINNDYNYVYQTSTSYLELLFRFIKTCTGIELNSEKLNFFLKGIRSNSEILICNAINSMNKDEAITIYGYMSKFKDIIGIEDSTLNTLEKLIKDKIENDELIIIKPDFSQLFEPNFFQLEYNNDKYFVPLWHEEVEFDIPNENKIIIVKVSPEFPQGINIDDTGCIHVECKININILLKNGSYDINVGPEKITLYARNILIKPFQTIIIKNRGIIQMDCQNIMWSNTKGDIHIHLELYS